MVERAVRLEDTTAELESIQSILHAANFAAQKHAVQKRKGAAAEPYINHLLEVAELVSTSIAEPDTNLIQAALLHDVIEDCGVTKEELAAQFGQDVADLVMEVTDDKSLPKAERKRLQVATAPHRSERAQVLKLADKISNLRVILISPPADWTVQRQREYFQWAKEVVEALPSPNPALKAEFERVFFHGGCVDAAGTPAIRSAVRDGTIHTEGGGGRDRAGTGRVVDDANCPESHSRG